MVLKNLLIFVHLAHVNTWRGDLLRVKTANNWKEPVWKVINPDQDYDGVIGNVPFSDPCDQPEIENGVISPTSATVNSGESYIVTCSSGYSLSDISLSTLTCTNGELSARPTCEPGILEI